MYINISLLFTTTIVFCVLTPSNYGQQQPNPYSSSSNTGPRYSRQRYSLLQQLQMMFQGMFQNNRNQRPWWQPTTSAPRPNGWPRPQQPPPNIPALAATLGHADLVTLLTHAGLAQPLSGTGPFTVFAPTDAAFSDALTPEVIEDMKKNTDKLRKTLKYHILQFVVFSSQFKNEAVAQSAGGSVRINVYPSNGAYPSNQTTITAQCTVLDTKKLDRRARNGVIHVLNGVMTPPIGSIMDAVQAMQGFGTLAMALDVAGLAEALLGAGPFTLFAPSDDAFTAVPASVVSAMMSNATLLRHVLTYHLVRGTVCGAGLREGGVASAQGAELQVSVGSGVKVNAATVTRADVSVTNGVMHVIDQVLVPPQVAGHVTQLLAQAN